MKKLLTILLCLFLLNGFLFAGGQQEKAAEEEAPAEEAAAEEEKPAEEKEPSAAVSTFDSAEHPKDEPLKLAFDMGYVPFHYYDENGDAAGFGIEVSRELAKRLGRPGIEILDVNWSGIFAGLFAKQYEAITFTLNITQDRAERMDYIEPIMDSGLKMICREGDEGTFTSPESFEGYKVAVNSGSVADTWVTENASEYGFSVDRYDKIDEAVLALMTEKVDGALAQIATMSTFVQEKEGLANAFTISPKTDFGLGHAGYSIAVRKGDAYRYEIERAMEQMKLDGTMQKLMEPYFGKPGPEDYANLIFVGYGTPGLRAYEPEEYHSYEK
jgi:polar amino acid transport system substrate-binding protein